MKAWPIVVVLLSACVSRLKSENPRPLPSRLLSQCSEVLSRIQVREQFYSSLRGSARLMARGDSVDLDLAMMRPYFLRAEVAGPLGLRMGLVQINSDWVQFYDSRKRRVDRLPFSEFQLNSLRRERFLSILPFPILGPNFVDYALSRTGLTSKDTNKIPDDKTENKVDDKILRSCTYDKSKNVYDVLFVDESEFSGRNRWHWIEVDPTNFFPVRHFSVLADQSQSLTIEDASWKAPEWDLRYSNYEGTGFATLPRKLEVYQRDALLWSFEWLEAERIQDRGEEIFQWRPSASMSVQDY